MTFLPLGSTQPGGAERKQTQRFRKPASEGSHNPTPGHLPQSNTTCSLLGLSSDSQQHWSYAPHRKTPDVCQLVSGKRGSVWLMHRTRKEPGLEDPILRGFVYVKSRERQNYSDSRPVVGRAGRGRVSTKRLRCSGWWECSLL